MTATATDVGADESAVTTFGAGLFPAFALPPTL